MEKESNTKIEKLEKFVLRQEKDIRELKKRKPEKLTKMKFVGVVFDPEKFKDGETEINDALADGFEVIQDFQTGGGIVMALGKWEKIDEKVKNEWTK